MRIKDIPNFERINKLNINVSELSSNDKALSHNFVNEKYYEEQIDLLLSEKHYGLINNLHNFWESNDN